VVDTATLRNGAATLLVGSTSVPLASVLEVTMPNPGTSA